MAINVLSIILLAILHLLPNTAKQFTVQTPDKQAITFEKRSDGFWYAAKSQGQMFEGIQLKEGSLMTKTGDILVNAADMMRNGKAIAWKEVDVVAEAGSFIKVLHKKKGCEISIGDSKQKQVFKAKWK